MVAGSRGNVHFLLWKFCDVDNSSNSVVLVLSGGTFMVEVFLLAYESTSKPYGMRFWVCFSSYLPSGSADCRLQS